MRLRLSRGWPTSVKRQAESAAVSARDLRTQTDDAMLHSHRAPDEAAILCWPADNDAPDEIPHGMPHESVDRPQTANNSATNAVRISVRLLIVDSGSGQATDEMTYCNELRGGAVIVFFFRRGQGSKRRDIYRFGTADRLGGEAKPEADLLFTVYCLLCSEVSAARLSPYSTRPLEKCA